MYSPNDALAFWPAHAWAKNVLSQGKPKATGLAVENYQVLHRGTLSAQQHGRERSFMVSGIEKLPQ